MKNSTSSLDPFITAKPKYKISLCSKFQSFFSKIFFKKESKQKEFPIESNHAKNVQKNNSSSSSSTLGNEIIYNNDNSDKLPKKKHHTKVAIEKFSSNIIQILNSIDNKYCILIKITEKNIQNISEFKSYISQRIKSNLLYDFSGDPDCYPFFSSFSERILSVYNLESENLLSLKKGDMINIKPIKIDNFSNQNFSCIVPNLKLKSDTLYLNPSLFLPDFGSLTLKSKETKAFFTNIRSLTNNIAIIIDKNIENISELAELFSYSFRHHKKCGFEFERVYCQGKLKFLIVYHGESSQFTEKEELDFLTSMFETKTNELIEKIRHTLQILSFRISNFILLKLIKITQNKFNELLNDDHYKDKFSLFELYKQAIKKYLATRPSSELCSSNLKLSISSNSISTLKLNRSKFVKSKNVFKMNMNNILEQSNSILNDIEFSDFSNDESKPDEESKFNERFSEQESIDRYFSEYSLSDIKLNQNEGIIQDNNWEMLQGSSENLRDLNILYFSNENNSANSPKITKLHSSIIIQD